MLKEAIEKIEAMTGPEVLQIDGRNYAIGKDYVREILPDLHPPLHREVNSLDALVHLIESEAGLHTTIYVSVAAYNRVDVFTDPRPLERWIRPELFTAFAADVPGWDPVVNSGFDEATVQLITRFMDSPDREYCLRLLSQITTGAKVTYADNGIASTIVMTKGAQLAENVLIKPIVRLKPYRTFQEVDQPEGLFLIRIHERGIKFIEADGGMWKLEARQIVKCWLEAQLKEIPSVVVML